MNKHCAHLFILVIAVCSFSVFADDNTENALKPPRSIIVIPAMNDSANPQAPYALLSTVSKPLVKAGYYVFPVALIDHYFKQNGLPTPSEMNTIEPAKLYEITGAEAVLYMHIQEYGQLYRVISSNTVVEVSAKLVDTRTGEMLWRNSVKEVKSNGNYDDDIKSVLVAALLNQIVESSHDSAYTLARQASRKLFSDKKHFPRGPIQLK